MIDTATIPAARVMFVGGDLVPLLKGMTDLFGNKAFISVQHYADAGTVLNGEIGSIDNFRIVQVPEMLHWAGAGAVVGTNPGYQATTTAGVTTTTSSRCSFSATTPGPRSASRPMARR